MNQYLGYGLQLFLGQRNVRPNLLRIISLYLCQIKKVRERLQNVATLSQNRNGDLPRSHTDDSMVKCFFLRTRTAVQVLIDEQITASGCLTTACLVLKEVPFAKRSPRLPASRQLIQI